MTSIQIKIDEYESDTEPLIGESKTDHARRIESEKGTTYFHMRFEADGKNGVRDFT